MAIGIPTFDVVRLLLLLKRAALFLLFNPFTWTAAFLILLTPILDACLTPFVSIMDFIQAEDFTSDFWSNNGIIRVVSFSLGLDILWDYFSMFVNLVLSFFSDMVVAGIAVTCFVASKRFCAFLYSMFSKM